MIGRQGLEAWGYRLGILKGTYDGPWDAWSKDMQDYCEQDVEVTSALWNLVASKGLPYVRAVEIEHEVARIVFKQEQAGAPFDVDAAHRLYAELVQKRLELERELQGVFQPWFAPGPLFTPKRDNKKEGYVAGAQCQKVKLTTFNPGSRDHIADRLIKLRGWKPKEFGSDGKPTVDEKILSKLPYPEAKQLTRYLLVQKRIGQLAEGKEALLKRCGPDGRIHGEVDSNSCVTARASHKRPNLAQVPKVKKDKVKGILKGEEGGWGYEMRSCFIAPPGWLMLGCDASGLELRMLGHYMSRWDGGSYAKEVVEGDVHARTLEALSPMGCTSRDVAKTWGYAWLYGAGDAKLGTFFNVKIPGERILKEMGAKSRSFFLKALPALKFLVDAVKVKAKKEGHLKGLDGRSLRVRSEHAALNTLLQSAGALVCKMWLVILHRELVTRGFEWGRDYQQILWVHDEVQLLVRPEIADEIGKIAVEAVKRAGEAFGLKVPLDGEYKTGRNWAETH